MTIEHAREVLAGACGRSRQWFAHRAGWVQRAIKTVLRSSRATEDDTTLAVSVELSMHGRDVESRRVLLG